MGDVALSLNDLCKVLQVGPGAAYRLLKERKLTAAKVGRRWRVSPQAVQEFLQSGSGGNGTSKSSKGRPH